MLLFIKSVIIGICALLPGVSGSVIAVTFGIYDKYINIINSKKIKENLPFLIITILGVILGIIISSNMLLYLFRFKTLLYYSLAGIILSEVPFLIKKIHIETKNGIMFIPVILSFIFSLVLDLLNSNNVIENYSVIKYFLGGILFAYGKVFPGISSSFFLLCLGIYDNIIIIINKPLLLINNLYYYVPFIIGTIFGLLIFIKLISYMMNKYFRFTYSMIIGFVLSSIIVIIPKFYFDFIHIIGIILMNVCLFLSIYIKNKK